MPLLINIPAGNEVVVEKLHESEEGVAHLRGIGIFENGKILIVKNEIQSQRPLLIEVFGAHFMIERELAAQIVVSKKEDD